MTAREYLKSYFGERQERKTEDKPYNYLDEFKVDSWARQHMEEEIVMDWGNVPRVRNVEIVEKWDKSELAQTMKKDGRRYMKVLVECPTHGYHYKVMSDPPIPSDCWCDKCITEEIDKVLSARAVRDAEYRRKQKEK